MVAGMGRNGFGMYFFFGSISACAVVFTWFLVPETKSVPLDQMDRLFEVKPVWKAQGIVMQELAESSLEWSKVDRKDESDADRIDGV